MTASTHQPSRPRAATRRTVLLPIPVGIAIAVVVAVVVLAVVLLTSTVAPARGTAPSNDGSPDSPAVLSGQSVPTEEDVMSPTEEACQLARVAGC